MWIYMISFRNVSIYHWLHNVCLRYLTIFHNWNLSQKVWYAVIFFMKKNKNKIFECVWVIEILKFSWKFSTLFGSEKEFQSLFEMIQIKDRNYLHLALIFTKVQKYGVMENLKKIFKVLFFSNRIISCKIHNLQMKLRCSVL